MDKDDFNKRLNRLEMSVEVMAGLVADVRTDLLALRADAEAFCKERTK